MSRNNHAKMMRKLFGQLGVETAKITHELRIFATQLMYEMGVSLEVSRPGRDRVAQLAAGVLLADPCVAGCLNCCWRHLS